MLFSLFINFLIIGNLARCHVPVKQPAFKSSPMSFKSAENETVFLPCVVEDLRDSFVRWWKDETLLSDSSSPRMLIPLKITVLSDGMTIDSLEPEDEGHYTCELVRPKPWSSLRLTHSLQVVYPPRIFLSPANGSLEVILGERVHMECAAKGVPPPTVTWRTKGFAIPSTGESRQVLEFTAANRLMSGVYQCEADNGVGNPVHGNVFLRILHKPEVTTEKSWVHSAPNIKTTLSCRILANPEARVEWFFNGEPLKPSPPRVSYKVRGDDHVLQFASVSPSDFGNYTCSARNSLGASQGFMQLSGVANPVVFKKVDSKSTDSYTLVWEVDSYSPVFEYKLLFRNTGRDHWASFIIPADSFPSGPLHSKSYTFSGLDKFSVYEAKIFSRNRFGWSNSSEVVTFGLTKDSYTEGAVIANEKLSISEAASSSSSSSAPLLVFPLLSSMTFISFLCIYGIS